MKRRLSAYTARRRRQLVQKETEKDLKRIHHTPQCMHSSLPDESISSSSNAPEIVSTHEDAYHEDISNQSANDANREECGESDSVHSSDTFTYTVETLNESNVSNLSNDLRLWAIEHNISNTALTALLVTLRKNLNECSLPKDGRTLLKTPRLCQFISVSEKDDYWYSGLQKPLETLAQYYITSKQFGKPIQLIANIDGLPIFKSSTACLWPILISDTIFKQVFLIGAYFGHTKPKDSNKYLEPFVNELCNFTNNGINCNLKHISVKLHAIVADAPAKSLILKVKNHNGYNSCTKCTVHGEYIDGRMSFITKSTDANVLRTNEKFKINEYEDYQLDETVLNKIPNFGLVTDIPLDPMHLVYLGVVKKILSFWISGPLSVRLRSSAIIKISNRLLSLRNNVPNDFQRRPRSLTELKNWKATEFRQFLLYTGPIVLSTAPLILKKDVYLNFMTLHVAITILSSTILINQREMLEYAHELLTFFVDSFSKLYGEKYVSHNIHNLLHLSTDVLKYGSIESFSAFRFENYLSSIKKMIRKPERPLQQLAKRYGEIEKSKLEINNVPEKEICLKQSHTNGPLDELDINTIIKQYYILETNLFNINCSNSKTHCCLLTNGEVISPLNFVQTSKEVFIIGKLFKYEGHLYNTPLLSVNMDISIVSATTNISARPLKMIKAKMWLIKISKNYVALPLLHTYQQK